MFSWILKDDCELTRVRREEWYEKRCGILAGWRISEAHDNVAKMLVAFAEVPGLEA